MLIVCKTCASSYHIPHEILGENGCRLRCVGCGEAWTVTPGAMAGSAAPIVEAERLPVAASAAMRAAIHYPAPRFTRGTAAVPRRETPRRNPDAPKRRAGKVFAVFLALGCAMGAIAARAAIVRAVPPTARIFAAIGLPVNLRGLALDNVRTNIFDSGDRKVLIVEGAIANLRDQATETPNMRIALRGPNKQELYVWTAPAPKARLGPNEQVAFRTRLAAPPEGVSDVQVRFAGSGDKLSPVREGL